MKNCSMLVVSMVLCLATTVMTSFDFQFEDVDYSPLPVFVSMGYQPAASGESGVIGVEYLAPEKPHVIWFVDGFPLPEGSSENYFRSRGATLLTLNREYGRQLSVCLQNDVGETCLQFAPLPANLGIFEEDLAFPWPLLTPAPLARYNAGENVTIHAPVLETEHNYTYSVRLLAKNPSRPDGPLVQAHSRDMVGGRRGDVVRIGPVKRGTGWMLEVDTNATKYEGVLMFSTFFHPDSELVDTCMETRPISFYRRGHSAPFPKGFVAMVPFPQPWRCREHFDCLVLCPFVSNGNVSLTLWPMDSDAALYDLPLERETTPIEGKARMLGPFYGWGSFYIREYRSLWDQGTYMCRADSHNVTVINLVEVF